MMIGVLECSKSSYYSFGIRRYTKVAGEDRHLLDARASLPPEYGECRSEVIGAMTGRCRGDTLRIRYEITIVERLKTVLSRDKTRSLDYM